MAQREPLSPRQGANQKPQPTRWLGLDTGLSIRHGLKRRCARGRDPAAHYRELQRHIAATTANTNLPMPMMNDIQVVNPFGKSALPLPQPWFATDRTQKSQSFQLG
jgi:hypothetical protein